MDGKELTGANGNSVLMTVTDYNTAIDKAPSVRTDGR